MDKRRVVITGLGLVSCFGSDIDVFFNSLLAGKSGVRPITEFDVSDMPTRFAAWARDVPFESYVEKKLLRRSDPYIPFSVLAGKRALEDAGLVGEQLDSLRKARCGVLVGSGMGGMQLYYDGAVALAERGYRKVSPFFVPFIITNMGGAQLAIEVGFKGPNYSISTACATGTFSVINAANHIRYGEADVMLCGGVEASANRITLAGFAACRALSQRNDAPEKASRPWDRNRDGFVIGEGCGVIVLESLDHALERGAHIYAEYLGGGVSCDAYHYTNIREDGSGVAQCIETALANGGIDKSRVNYINAHATSTPAGDMAEVAGVRSVFGLRSDLKMNATKSLIGHALGGAGAIELIATVKSIETGMVHPTLNCDDPEEGLIFDIVPQVAQRHHVDVAISNSFGFGGHNSCIALSRYEP